MSNRNGIALLIALLLMTIVAGVFGYLYFEERNTTSTQQIDLEVRVLELATAEIKLDSVSKELDIRIETIKNFGGDISALEKAKLELISNRSQVRNNAGLFQKKMREVIALLNQKDREILQFKDDNQILLSEIQQLAQQNNDITQAKLRVQDSLILTIKKNKELESKVSKIAIVKAKDIKIYAITSKGKVRNSDDIKSRRIDKIKIDFTLERNELLDLQNINIYLRILDSKGATISNDAISSGIFTYRGQELKYTTKQDVKYTNNNQVVSIVYHQTNTFAKGSYQIEIYTSDLIIGQSSFTVK